MPKSSDSFVYEAPGPGEWNLDRSHLSNPATPLIQSLMTESLDSAYRQVFEELGLPAETISMQFVNGFGYTQTRPLIGAERTSSRTQPRWLSKLIFRLHPELRRRERRAKKTLRSEPWTAVVANWPKRAEELTEANLELQGIHLGSLDNDELADHLTELFNHARTSFREHHVLHASDLPPIGLLVYECKAWGIPPADSVSCLVGASPNTAAPVRALNKVKEQLIRARATPTTLEEAREASAGIAAQIDEYLHLRGSTLYSGYDIDCRTLDEDPDVVLKSILHSRDPDIGGHAAIVADLRMRVPADKRSLFDRRIREARAAMHMRDEQGPLSVEWPLGLLRHGLLEAGRRAMSGGGLHKLNDIFELHPSELDPFVRSRSGPSADELSNRSVARATQTWADPPRTIGSPPLSPQLEALPRSMRRLAQLVAEPVGALGMTRNALGRHSDHSLSGVGVGEHPFVGAAVVARDAGEAMARLEPGEVLVTHATSPAFNLVLSMAGALVTATGGPLSHAAVLARELGLPAVIGVPTAMDAIKDGDIVEVDPVAGTVTVV